MTTYSIRPFKPTTAEYEAVLRVNNAAWPDEPGTVEDWKHDDQERNRNFLFQRFVVENEDKRIIAAGACWESAWSHVPGKYLFGFEIDPVA